MGHLALDNVVTFAFRCSDAVGIDPFGCVDSSRRDPRGGSRMKQTQRWKRPWLTVCVAAVAFGVAIPSAATAAPAAPGPGPSASTPAKPVPGDTAPRQLKQATPAPQPGAKVASGGDFA